MSTLNTTSKRRRFVPPLQQTSLETYLHPHARSAMESSAISPSGLLSPSLPREVQVSLLQVGMRTRKAVSDGYKTTTKTPYIYTDPATANRTDSMSFEDQIKAFCASPPVVVGPYTFGDKTFDSIFNTSNTASPSATSSMPPPTSRKRALSSSTTSPTRDTSMSPPLRPIAQPKSRRRVVPVVNACGAWDYDEAMKIDDFGEADFLKLEELEGERRVLGGMGAG